MSAISSRPKVRKVSGTVMPAAAVMAGALVAALWRGLSSAAKSVYEDYQKRPAVRPPADIGPVPTFPVYASLPITLSPIERIQVGTLLAVSQTPCLVEEPHEISTRLGALVNAATAEQATAAQSQLFLSLEAGHQRVFLRSISDACRKAADRIGFTHTELKTAGPGELRVVSTDAAGRSLVSEIRVDRHREVHMETEVVGGEGCCQQILDRFEAELENEGLRSGPRSRRSTGGVCQLDGAKAVVNHKDEEARPLAQRRQQNSRQQTRSR